jgi:hypothetical protein
MLHHKLDFKHLEKVGETYFEHFWNTFKYASLFLGLTMIILIHGVFPFIFTTTASSRIKLLNKELSSRQPRTHNE